MSDVTSSDPNGSQSNGSPSNGSHSTGSNPADRAAEREQLAALVRKLGVVHGKVTLSSGREADYYVDLRRVTLQHEAAPLVGRLLRELTKDWAYEAVGGLTLGADPVADAVLHAAAAEHTADPAAQPVDAFVVRKAVKEHGMQRQIEGPDIAGRRVLVVEDTSTTGASVRAALDAVRAAGATVVGVAVVVDRGTGAREVIEAEGVPYRALLGLADLHLS